MERNELAVISYQLSVISYQLSVISYQLSVISYQFALLAAMQLLRTVVMADVEHNMHDYAPATFFALVHEAMLRDEETNG